MYGLVSLCVAAAPSVGTQVVPKTEHVFGEGSFHNVAASSEHLAVCFQLLRRQLARARTGIGCSGVAAWQERRCLGQLSALLIVLCTRQNAL